MRFDQAIAEKYQKISRSRAAQRIKQGDFSINGRVIKKAAYSVKDGDIIAEAGNSIPFVSRGGLKLQAALDAFSVDPAGLTCLDVGASTGGFTECLLTHGARRVFAVDVGSSQLADDLRQDARVTVMENRDIRDIRPEELIPTPALVVADVSFISLRKIWDCFQALSKAETDFLVLFKPQFETDKKSISKNGIVNNPKTVYESMGRLLKQIYSDGYRLIGLIPSPIRGKQGNMEFLMHVRKSEHDRIRNEEIKEIIDAAYRKGE